MSTSFVARLQALVNRHLHNYAVALVLAFLCLYLSVTTTTFLTSDNIANVLEQVSMIGIIAMGMTMLLVSGNFDLSVGGIVALVGVIAADVYNGSGLVLAVVVALAAGLALGSFNGLVVTVLRVNSLMATLGTGLAYSGLALLVSSSSPVALESTSMQKLVGGDVVGIPAPVIAFAAVIAASTWFLHATVGGREVYAVGANVDAARYAGVRVERVRFIPFAIVGVLCAVAALILMGQLNTALPDAAGSWALQVIAAAVVGGVSIAGGRGTIFMAVVGVLLIGVVNNGFNLKNLDANYQSIFTGAIIVLAVAVDSYLRKRAAAAVQRRPAGEPGPREPSGDPAAIAARPQPQVR
jgi:ribose/xylose/arabinose/galactoside ABC-type transport system permease subunit